MTQTESQNNIRVFAPASGELLGEAPVTDEAAVRAAVDRARAAQVAWGALPVRQRCKAMRAFRTTLARHGEALAEAIARENGKPLQEALSHDLVPVLDLMAWFETRAPRILARQKLPLHFLLHRSSYLLCVPRGVVGVIGPWNFPLSIPVGDASMALFAGNAVVVKPSEFTPLIAMRVKALWDEACRLDPRLTPDLFQVVTGRGPTGAAVIRAGVDQVMFTGSVPTGRKVALACAERLIPCVLELGGINPAIVTADADLDRTAHALVWGGFANSGQVCASVSRVYVDRRVVAPLTDKMVKIIEGLRQGDPLDAAQDMGAMTSAAQVEIGREILADTVAQGGRVRTGGDPNGRYFPPTLVDRIQHGWRITREESFAPLLAVIEVDSDEQAIRMANDSDKGLMAYVFCGNRAKAKSIAERMEAGTTMVNNCLDTHAAAGTPWQGVKESGLGQVHSAQGLRDLTQVRHVHGRNHLPWFKKELWWFPYSQRAYRGWLGIIGIAWSGGWVDRLMRFLRR
jgi:succinate-semialdehyde dehydrogenase/glutarate-semialdehyde dehydrogenase